MNCGGLSNSVVGGTTPPGELSQTAFFVDSANGNDANPGTQALPIQTLKELQLRFEGKRLTGDTTVTLIGTFAEYLTLNTVVPDGMLLTIVGPVTSVYSGTIGVFTALNSGTLTPASLQDAGLVAATQVQRRFRMTSGAAASALAWGLLAAAADTERVSQFTSPTNGALQNPAVGDTYEVETFDTTIAGYSLSFSGGGDVEIRDLTIAHAVPGSQSNATNSGLSSLRLIGCQFITNLFTLIDVGSASVFRACQMIPTSFYRQGNYAFQGCAAFGSMIARSNSVFNMSLSPTCFQGGKLTADRNSYIELATNLGFFDLPAGGGDAAVTASEGSRIDSTVAGAIVWTVNPLQAFGIRVRSYCSYVYVTQPTATGVTADTVIGGTNTAYGVIPFIEATNNAGIVLRA